MSETLTRNDIAAAAARLAPECGSRKITLCGSARFRRAFAEWNARLTLEGHLVYGIALGPASRTAPTEAQKLMLDAVHFAKIEASDETFVLNIGGYIGESTAREIEHAFHCKKRIRYLDREYPGWTEADCTLTDPPPAHAVLDVYRERLRQIEAEGWTPAHDDEHADGILAKLAGSYAVHSTSPSQVDPRLYRSRSCPSTLPWSYRDWWKPKDPRRDLVRAGALILAEIERLDRMAAATPATEAAQ